MIKLFLSSFFTEAAGMLPNFLKCDCAGKKVAFIPTAGLHEEDTSYIESDRAALRALGLVIQNLEITEASYETIRNTLTNADFIFVCGGNTFVLLQELKRTGTGALLAEHIFKGKPYISTSAGSCILSKNVIADGIDSIDAAPYLKGDYSALSIVEFYVYPHYGHNYGGEPDEQILEKYYKNMDVKRISDKQAVTVDGEQIRIITANGKGDKAI